MKISRSRIYKILNTHNQSMKKPRKSHNPKRRIKRSRRAGKRQRNLRYKTLKKKGGARIKLDSNTSSSNALLAGYQKALSNYVDELKLDNSSSQTILSGRITDGKDDFTRLLNRTLAKGISEEVIAAQSADKNLLQRLTSGIVSIFSNRDTGTKESFEEQLNDIVEREQLIGATQTELTYDKVSADPGGRTIVNAINSQLNSVPNMLEMLHRFGFGVGMDPYFDLEISKQEVEVDKAINEAADKVSELRLRLDTVTKEQKEELKTMLDGVVEKINILLAMLGIFSGAGGGPTSILDYQNIKLRPFSDRPASKGAQNFSKNQKDIQKEVEQRIIEKINETITFNKEVGPLITSSIKNDLDNGIILSQMRVNPIDTNNWKTGQAVPQANTSVQSGNISDGSQSEEDIAVDPNARARAEERMSNLEQQVSSGRTRLPVRPSPKGFGPQADLEGPLPPPSFARQQADTQSVKSKSPQSGIPVKDDKKSTNKDEDVDGPEIEMKTFSSSTDQPASNPNVASANVPTNDGIRQPGASTKEDAGGFEMADLSESNQVDPNIASASVPTNDGIRQPGASTQVDPNIASTNVPTNDGIRQPGASTKEDAGGFEMADLGESTNTAKQDGAATQTTSVGNTESEQSTSVGSPNAQSTSVGSPNAQSTSVGSPNAEGPTVIPESAQQEQGNILEKCDGPVTWQEIIPKKVDGMTLYLCPAFTNDTYNASDYGASNFKNISGQESFCGYIAITKYLIEVSEQYPEYWQNITGTKDDPHNWLNDMVNNAKDTLVVERGAISYSPDIMNDFMVALRTKDNNPSRDRYMIDSDLDALTNILSSTICVWERTNSIGAGWTYVSSSPKQGIDFPPIPEAINIPPPCLLVHNSSDLAVSPTGHYDYIDSITGTKEGGGLRTYLDMPDENFRSAYLISGPRRTTPAADAQASSGESNRDSDDAPSDSKKDEPKSNTGRPFPDAVPFDNQMCKAITYLGPDSKIAKGSCAGNDVFINYFTVLGLEKPEKWDSDFRRSVRRAYARLSRQYHPDKLGKNNSEQFQCVGEAYTVLVDQALYNRYIAIMPLCMEEGASAPPPPPPPPPPPGASSSRTNQPPPGASTSSGTNQPPPGASSSSGTNQPPPGTSSSSGPNQPPPNSGNSGGPSYRQPNEYDESGNPSETNPTSPDLQNQGTQANDSDSQQTSATETNGVSSKSTTTRMPNGDVEVNIRVKIPKEAQFTINGNAGSRTETVIKGLMDNINQSGGTKKKRRKRKKHTRRKKG